MSTANKNHLILAIYPTTRGYAFVLFEGPESPFDWGVREIKEKHRNLRTVQSIKELIDRYRPEALVMEDTRGLRYRRATRIKKLYRMLTHLAASEYVDLVRIDQAHVRKYFMLAGAVTKYERAQAIALQIPAFSHRVPRPRKAWMSEDPRQSLFDAAALGLVYYGLQGIPSPYLKLPDS
jgi:hypothetical protein